MANVLIDTFSFYNLAGEISTLPNVYLYTLNIYYDAVKDKFTQSATLIIPGRPGAKLSNFPVPTNLLVDRRGKSDNQEISFSCSGQNKISFQATLTTPFVKRVIVANSGDCGYVQPTPPPVCDLLMTTTSTEPSFGDTNGTVTVNLSTVNAGLAVIKISKDNVVVNLKTLNLSTDKSTIFLGLESGDYKVIASLTQFGCAALSNITVQPALTPPPPVCDLVLEATSTRVTAIGAQDGTITTDLSTSNTGYAALVLYKDGVEVPGRATSILLSSTHTYTFTALEDGNYTVKASLVDFTCEKLVNIIVEPAPALVCDLEVTVTTTPLNGLNSKDGTVKVELTTENTGLANIFLLKNGRPAGSTTIDLSTPEFTFTGLDSGVYFVFTSLVQFLCQKTEVVTVLPMSFNEKYYFEYCEQRFGNRPIKVSLKKKNYSGVTNKIQVAQKVVTEIDWKSESEYKFEPILGSSCDINLISMINFEYADLFITEEQDTLVEIFLDDVLFWTGYLTGDRATEDFKSPPYQISLSALDGIKLLKDQDFDLNNQYISFLEAIKFILDKTNLSLPFKTMCDLEDKTPNVDYKLLTGLETSVYGNSVVVNDGTGVINGVPFNITGGTFVIPDLPSGVYEKKYYLIASSTSVYLSPTFDIANYAVLLIAPVIQTPLTLTAKRTRLTNGDVLNDHLFNENVFVLSEEKFTNCTEALEFICRQFTCSVKQEGGYWVIENIGAKARLNTLEYNYDRDLNFIAAIQRDLVKNIDCSQDTNDVLSGASISLITGDKQSTVHWKLGYPKPIFGNYNFEQWYIKDGAEIPAQWQLTKPYGWFNKGSKFDKIYDPVTGILTDVENGSYYFNIKKGTFGSKAFKSTDVIVFNQEVVNISFQLIITNKKNSSGRYIIGFKFKIGNYICANSKIGQSAFDPKWFIDDGTYSFQYIADFDDTKFLAFGDEPNVNLTLPPAPVQGGFNMTLQAAFITSVVGNTGVSGTSISDLGFDNFKIKKTSPVSNVKTIEDATITVLNGNKFSNVPEDFEVVMGDVDTNLRTDGIRTLNYGITQLWARKGVTELEALNNIICKELLSQYQQNTRIFEGQILGEEITVRNIFNLPTLDLFRFVPISFKYDLGACIADVSMVEVYAEDGQSSGSIGGGSGGSPNTEPRGYILGTKNNIFTDGNDNLFNSLA